ncbi:MAG: protein kinase [Gemmatimonadaceae bacterium]|jgi:serine/threonine-protein kinase|nr:protein kinase [Gemmatimonadaceae bacterium]
MSPDSHESLHVLQQAVGPAYRLERVIGTGGTATVCLAQDERHGRRVAVKVLRHELSATVGADRFLNEIRLAARLTHPHIVPLLDSGGTRVPFFVMPYIEGESLRARLGRGPAFTVDEALALVTEVADALEYAHAAGIVHRDIKPENILLLRGHALVADFGIARAFDAAIGPARTTSAGIVLGTPAYMSPEQAAGDPGLDGRTDVYSLATVLFEMLAGRPPFTAPTTQGLIARRFVEVAPRLDRLRADAPATVVEAIAAALALEPADRPAGAAAFGRRLREPREAAPAVTGEVPTYRTTSLVATSGPTVPSIAVLPFRNLGAAGDDEFLSDGLTEEIISTLSRLRTLKVAARASTFAFKARAVDVREIAGRLGVTNVLDGSVRRAGARVRVTAELVDATTGFQVWAERYDRAFDDAFAIQDDIARAIADALSATLLAGPSTGAPAVAGPAYEAFLRGRFALHRRTEGALREALGHFESALTHDARFAPAQLGVAEACLLLGVYGADDARLAMPQARTAAAAALALDPSLGEAWAIEGAVAALHDWQLADADAAYRRALALAPRAPTLWQGHALHVLVPMGRHAEARAAIERARALDPLSMIIATSVGVVYHLTGDLPAALAALARAAALDPDFAMTHYFLGGAHRDAGDLASAARAFERATALSGGSPEMRAGLAQVQALAGDAAGAREGLADLAARRATRIVSHCLSAQILAALGDIDGAVAALAAAEVARDPELVYLTARPAYASLLGDARVQALRGRLGL